MARFNSGRIHNVIITSIASFELVLDTRSADDGNEDKSATVGNEATVTVTDNYSKQAVPAEIDTVVVTDNRSFEILDQWGVELVAAPKAIIPLTVSDYKDNPDVQNIGNHHEPNLEIIAAADPGLIITGQRFDEHYDDLKKFAPNPATVNFEPREGKPLDEELKHHAKGTGTVFGKEKGADQLITDFDETLERAHKAYNPDVTVMALNPSGGTLGYIAPTVDRTFGPLSDLIGMKPALEVDKAGGDYRGDEIPAESIAKVNPDFITVLDRSAGTSVHDIGECRPAQSVVEEATPPRNVKAAKEGRVYYIPEDIYTNESIITYTEILDELADASEQV